MAGGFADGVALSALRQPGRSGRNGGRVGLIFTRQGARCELHPHRETERRCDRCGRPFCDECLLPGRREADGTRPWRCAACTAEVATTEVAIARAQSGRVRLARAIAAGRTLALVVVA